MPHQGERKLMQHYTFHTKVYCLFCFRKAVGTVFRRTFAAKKFNPYDRNNEEECHPLAAQPALRHAEKNVSDAELARRLGLSRQTVNNIVNGRRSTTVGRLHEIAEALQVRVRELFDE